MNVSITDGSNASCKRCKNRDFTNPRHALRDNKSHEQLKNKKSQTFLDCLGLCSGGDEGIRTLDTSFGPYAPLAGECLRPLGHISVLPVFSKAVECMMIAGCRLAVNNKWLLLCGFFYRAGRRRGEVCFFVPSLRLAWYRFPARVCIVCR